MKKIKLNVKGMHCPSCEMLVGDSLEDLNGVMKAKLSHQNDSAEIEFDESKVSVNDIKKVIKDEGYEVE